MATGLSAACGSVDKAPETDAAIPIDAVATGTVSVTTLNRCMTQCTNPGQPAGNIDVVVVAPDGTVRDSGQTDGSGTIELDITAGDSVTAVYIDGVVGARLATFADARPGDHLTFGDDFETPVTSNPIGSMTFSWPAVGGASSYRVYTPCGSAGVAAPTLSVAANFYDTCGTGAMKISVVATDGTGVALAYQTMNGINFVNGGTATFTGWTTAPSFTLGTSGLADFITQVQLIAISLDTLNGEGFSVSLSGAPVGGALSTSTRFAPIGSRNVAEALYLRSSSFGPQIRLDDLGDAPTGYQPEAFDLPWVGQVIANPAAHQVTWIQDGPGDYDTGVIMMDWSRNGTQNFDWRVILPPGLESYDLPPLPGALSDQAPVTGDTVTAAVVLMEYGADDGYAATRARPEWEIDQILNGEGNSLLDIIPFKLAAPVNF